MHLSIDVREACRAQRTGKGQWTYGLVTELLSRDVPLRLYTDAPLPGAWSGAKQALIEEASFTWHIVAARRLLVSPPTIYVSPLSYIIPSLIGFRVLCVPVVHDLIAFQNETHDRRARFVERMFLGTAVKTALGVATVSDATRDDLLMRFPSLDHSKVTAVYAGPSTEPVPPPTPDGATILCVGTLCPRKNQLRLIEAFDRLPSPLRDRATLVLVGGRGWGDDEIVRQASSVPGVQWLKYVPDDALTPLFQRATVFALPSLYEGFGLTVLDAMRRGVPVLTSDRGSLKEVAGDAALVVDPDDAESIAAGLEKLLTDAGERRALAARGVEWAKEYSWKRTADLLLDALRRWTMNIHLINHSK